MIGGGSVNISWQLFFNEICFVGFFFMRNFASEGCISIG